MLKNNNSMLVKAGLPVLALLLTLGLTRLAKADVPESQKGVPSITVCCKDGKQTGNSNDCVSGTGPCVDRSCNSDETEESHCRPKVPVDPDIPPAE